MRYHVRQWSRILGRWQRLGGFIFATNAESYARQEHGGRWTQVIDTEDNDKVVFDTNEARLT